MKINDTTKTDRAKQRRAILTGRREAALQPGETLIIADQPAQPAQPDWYQAAILRDGRRCALAWWHRPTSTLCDRLTVG